MTESAPAKRFNLRWLTVGEIVGVAAVVLAGLGYWDAHRDRVAAAQANAARESLLMTGTPDRAGDRIRLAPARSDQVIQTQTIIFPAALHGGTVETTGNPRLEAGWIEGGLKGAGHARSGRAPIGVVTTFIEDGQTRTDQSIYQVGYSLHPRFVFGDKVQLEGLSLARRGVTGDLQAQVNAMWKGR
jgi:hypothetical protein